MFIVYSIKYNEELIYIGMTKDIKRRSKEHNYLFKKGIKKELYEYLNSVNFTSEIELNIISTFKNKTEAKRYEAMLILNDHFNLKKLKQKVPSIGR